MSSKRKYQNAEYEEQQRIRRKNTQWYQYVVDNNMLEHVVDKGERKVSKDFSHTLFTGGILNVPIEKYKPLLFALAKDIEQGYVPDLNEISAPLTRLYMDFDFKDEMVPGVELQLFSNRIIKEVSTGVGTKQFPAIVIEEEPLERQRYQNVSVADCVAQKVSEYFPLVEDKESNVFDVHCLWRPGRFSYETKEYVNTTGRHVSEKIVAKRSFGMHLIWPNLYVTHAEALDIREGVVRALSAKYHGSTINNRNRPGLNPWTEIVDQKIYLPLQSLRMVLSDKYEICNECEKRNLELWGTTKEPLRKKTKSITTDSAVTVESNVNEEYKFHCKCRGKGKVAANSIYKYHATVNASKKEVTETYRRVFEEQVYQMLLQCCIRDPRRPDLIRLNRLAPNDPVFVLPKDAPRYCGFKPKKNDSIQESKQKYTEFKNLEGSATSKNYIGSKTEEEFFVNSKEFNAVQNLFANAVSVVSQARRTLGAHTPLLDLSKYCTVAVYRLRRGCINGNYFYTVEITDTGMNNEAKYCLNIDRIHKCEKNVYFKINAKNGISQRCSCFSDRERRISCQKFESPPCPLPKGCQDILFSDDLLQKGIDKERESILIASKRKTPSILGMEKSKLNSLIEKPFRALAVDEADASVLKQFANGMLPTKANGAIPIVDEQNALTSSSNSPFDPIETAKIEKYDNLCEKVQNTHAFQLISLEDIEENKTGENRQSESIDLDLLPKVEKVIEKLQRIETKQSKDAVIAKKLFAAFYDTCSPAYHDEKHEDK